MEPEKITSQPRLQPRAPEERTTPTFLSRCGLGKKETRKTRTADCATSCIDCGWLRRALQSKLRSGLRSSPLYKGLPNSALGITGGLGGGAQACAFWSQKSQRVLRCTDRKIRSASERTGNISHSTPHPDSRLAAELPRAS